MSVLSDIVARFRAASPNIAAAFDEVERRLVALEGTPPPPPPPPVGILKFRPPGWNGGDPSQPTSFPGFQTVTRFEQCTNNNVDYYVLPHTVTATLNKTSGRTEIAAIPGGRHVVAYGVTLTGTLVNNLDDATGIIVEQGNPAGIVHLEGMKIAAPNGVTIRSTRPVQLLNCHITCRAWNDDHDGGSGIHPDIVQMWQGGTDSSRSVKMHRLTGYSAMTTFSTFLTGATSRWEMYDVDLHGVPPLNGSKPLLGANVWMGDPAMTTWLGSNLWWETPWETATSRGDLGDVARQFGTQYSPQSASFEIFDAAGQLAYTSPVNPTNGAGSGPNPVGGRQGDEIRFSRMPQLKHRWKAGVPPTSVGATGGVFVPPSSVGPGYVSPGYA